MTARQFITLQSSIESTLIGCSTTYRFSPGFHSSILLFLQQLIDFFQVSTHPSILFIQRLINFLDRSRICPIPSTLHHSLIFSSGSSTYLPSSGFDCRVLFYVIWMNIQLSNEWYRYDWIWRWFRRSLGWSNNFDEYNQTNTIIIISINKDKKEYFGKIGYPMMNIHTGYKK